MRYASVCDGIGAAHVAWSCLGWQCVWTAEIEPFPIAVVDHHWKLRNLGDVTAITEEMLHDTDDVRLLVGGTPCQSFSVAGLRGGLDDPRGNLALRFVQLAAVMHPRWVVWENVPGVFSSGKGRDFGTLLGALEQLGYGWAYRTLDAQWFGVAQRRRRVFLVGHLGDWRRAAAVLFERESVCGDPPTRGAAGQEVARTPAVVARGSGGHRPVAEQVYGVANCLTRRMHKGINTTLDEGQTPVIAFTGDGVIANPISAHEARTYTHEGTTFRLHNCVGQPFTKSKRAQSAADDETLVPGDVAPTQNQFDVGDTRATTVVAQGFTHSGYSNQPAWITGDRTDCLSSSGHSDGSHQGLGVIQSMAVRRLTPRECERLQGFPDDYTAITYRGKPAADGPRYRALGNSMAVPVMRWIGQRLAAVDAIPEERNT